MDEQDYIEFWRQMQYKIVKFKKLDDGKVIFGARTCQGHNYNVLPKVSDKEIMKFEKEHGLSLPLAYRTYLQIFAAGGAGPDNGIYDFRDSIMKGDYSEPFPYTQTIDRDDDNIDHDQLLKMPGTACISSYGNGAYCYLELNVIVLDRYGAAGMKRLQKIGMGIFMIFMINGSVELKLLLRDIHY